MLVGRLSNASVKSSPLSWYREVSNMDIKKVIIGLVFSMLFGSGVAVAANADDGGLSQQELFLALADTAVG